MYHVSRTLFLFPIWRDHEFRHLATSLEMKKKIPRPIYSTRIHREREARALLADKREPQNTETRIETISTATNTSNRHSFAMLDGPHVHGSIVFAPVLIALQLLLFPLPSHRCEKQFRQASRTFPFLRFDNTRLPASTFPRISNFEKKFFHAYYTQDLTRLRIRFFFSLEELLSCIILKSLVLDSFFLGEFFFKIFWWCYICILYSRFDSTKKYSTHSYKDFLTIVLRILRSRPDSIKKSSIRIFFFLREFFF